MNLSPYPNLRKAGKINSKDITERFLFSLSDSSVMSQTAERVCTLRSLIDRGYEIVGVVGKNIKK